MRSLNQPLFVERHAARPESRRPSAAAASCGRLECTCAKLRRCSPPAGSGHRVWPISVDTAASCAKRARTLQLPHERAMWHGTSMLIPRDRNMLAGELPKAKSHICAHAVVNRRVPGSDDSVQAADARRMRGGRGRSRKQARTCMTARARRPLARACGFLQPHGMKRSGKS